MRSIKVSNEVAGCDKGGGNGCAGIAGNAVFPVVEDFMGLRWRHAVSLSAD